MPHSVRVEVGLRAVFAYRLGPVRRTLDAVARGWLLVAVIAALGTLAFGWLQPPLYEVAAVVQADVPAADSAAHVLRPDGLRAVALRHDLNLGGRAAVVLRRAIAINDLTVPAGQSRGFAPQLAGVVVSVRWPDAGLAARLANDVAQQILDVGGAGPQTKLQMERDFLRRDELRLWHEVSALQAELEQAAGSVAAADAAMGGKRQLMLMQDQYAEVRQRLAGAEIAVRLADHLHGGKPALLARATAADAVSLRQGWYLPGIAGSLLIAVMFVVAMDGRWPALPHWPALQGRLAQVYLQFDDPARPILGVPRYAVTSALIVVWLFGIAGLIR